MPSAKIALIATASLALSACGGSSGGSTADLLNAEREKSLHIIDAIGSGAPLNTAPARASAQMSGLVVLQPTTGVHLFEPNYLGRMNLNADFAAGDFDGSVDHFVLTELVGGNRTIVTEYDGSLAVAGDFTFPRPTDGSMQGSISGTVSNGGTNSIVYVSLDGDIYTAGSGLAAVGLLGLDAGSIGGTGVEGAFIVGE